MSNTGSTRRNLLKKVALVGGAAVATGMLLPSSVQAKGRGAGPAGQVPGVSTVIDTSHASPQVVRSVSAYFLAKATRDVDATMAHFSKKPFTYTDGTLGLQFATWENLRDLFAQQMPTWPAGANSYPTRIIGDENSAIVYFSNNPGIFFPSEMRAISVVNFVRGKITRWDDYWDPNHVGAANLVGMKLPDNQFPADFGESLVGEPTAARIKRAATRLNTAMAANDTAAAAALFAPDATFVDLPAHVRVTGPRHIGTFLTGARGTLPYIGSEVKVRHVVGSEAGGGYEWTANGVVPRGVNVITLNAQGLITSFESMWDGARLDDSQLLRLATAAIER
ncbi:nuclear transport factor 2 family protein [Streptomyces sp. NPDC058653]|uniref:nuclear transport factor 2 family protein n=1 Tax=Streptomyces sp. NPDC058653 TaxID=3346576 RepID=UPI00365B377B